MFGPQRTTLSGQLPISKNPFPANLVHNVSLGKEAKVLSIFVPIYMADSNVKETKKQQSEKPIRSGGIDLDLVKSTDLKGNGSAETEKQAWLHPVKVQFITITERYC